jgi:hypothetical protein
VPPGKSKSNRGSELVEVVKAFCKSAFVNGRSSGKADKLTGWAMAKLNDNVPIESSRRYFFIMLIQVHPEIRLPPPNPSKNHRRAARMIRGHACLGLFRDSSQRLNDPTHPNHFIGAILIQLYSAVKVESRSLCLTGRRLVQAA